MTDNLIIDISRQPSQIRCIHCGFAQDLQLPMTIRDLVELDRRIGTAHRDCQPAPPAGPPPA